MERAFKSERGCEWRGWGEEIWVENQSVFIYIICARAHDSEVSRAKHDDTPVAHILTRNTGTSTHHFGARKPCQPSWASPQPYAMIGGKFFAAKFAALAFAKFCIKRLFSPPPSSLTMRFYFIGSFL